MHTGRLGGRVGRLISLLFAVGLTCALACSGQPGSSKAPPESVVKYDPKLPLLLEYGRPSCPYCQQERPILDELARQYRGRLNVSAVNVEEQSALADRAGVRLLPTIIFYRPGGQEVYRHVGFWPKADIVAKLRELGISG